MILPRIHTMTTCATGFTVMRPRSAVRTICFLLAFSIATTREDRVQRKVLVRLICHLTSRRIIGVQGMAGRRAWMRHDRIRQAAQRADLIGPTSVNVVVTDAIPARSACFRAITVTIDIDRRPCRG